MGLLRTVAGVLDPAVNGAALLAKKGPVVRKLNKTNGPFTRAIFCSD